MKNLILYYLALLAPGIILARYWHLLDPFMALGLLLFYVVIYRTLLDGFRLHLKGILPKNQIWKMALPGMRGKYFKELYLQK
jgi:hypothetical protein